MVASALFFLLFGVVSYAYGWGFLDLLQRVLLKKPADEKLSFAWVMLTGLVLVTTIAILLNFMLPLSGAALGMVIAAVIIMARWKSLKEHWRFASGRAHILFWVLTALVAAAVLEQSTHLPGNPDTGLYHAQTIRWIESYRVVPGLGNLNARFAYNSSWLVVNALFSLEFLGLRSFHLLPAAVFLTAMAVFLEGAAGWLRGKATLANILKTLLIPCAFYVASAEISSPGTDLPVILIAWLLAAGWLELGEEPPGSRPLFELVLFLLSIFAVTIKLSAGPLLIFAALLLLRRINNRRQLVIMTVLALAILLPWMARSVVLSGYPLFPVAGIPGFNLDWRISPGLAQREQLGIIAWGRDSGMDMEEVLKLPFSVWIQTWFFDQTANRKLLLLLAGASPFLFGLGWALLARRRESGLERTLPLLAVLVIFISGGLFWLFTSPDFRFGYGYLIVLLLLPWLMPFAFLRKLHKSSLPIVLLILAYLGYSMVSSFERSSFFERLLLPVDYRVLPTQPCDLKNGAILCPAEESWSQCWYEPFPCAPFPRPNVEMRGPDWSDGFREAD